MKRNFKGTLTAVEEKKIAHIIVRKYPMVFQKCGKPIILWFTHVNVFFLSNLNRLSEIRICCVSI